MDEGHGLLRFEEIARALREEFGVGIDAHPGSATNEPGQINVAFCVMVKSVLRMGAPSGEEWSGAMVRVLRKVAEQALNEHGVPATQADALLDLEPTLGNAWFAYLALAPRTVIHDLLQDEE